MKDFDEQDELWDLLGKAKKTPVSPYFSRNVLRAVRESKQEKSGAFAWLALRWRVVSLAGVAAVLVAVKCASFEQAPPASSSTSTPEVAKIAPVQSQPVAVNDTKPEDSDVVNDLDELVAYEKNNIWLDDSGR